jgi:hypothetical protein
MQGAMRDYFKMSAWTAESIFMPAFLKRIPRFDATKFFVAGRADCVKSPPHK